MKYGMNMLLWTTNVEPSHDPIFDMLKECGYDGVEIPLFQLEEASFQRLAKKLDSVKLDRTTVCCVGANINPISPDAAIRKAAVAHLKKAVDMSSVVGSKLLAGPFHSAIGEFTGKGPTADEWKRGKEVFSELAEYAKQHGVTLVFEYLNRFECYFLNCVADTARFCREVNHPNLRMMYDTFHANIEEKDIAQAIRDAAPTRCTSTFPKTTAARRARGTSTGTRRSRRSRKSNTTAGWWSKPSAWRCRTSPPRPKSGGGCSRPRNNSRATLYDS